MAIELRAIAGGSTIEAGVGAVMARDEVEVVVVKCGPEGAHVFARHSDPATVPAFQARSIYKVGSGDIFSAAFSHYWAEAQRSPVEAARLASLQTTYRV